MIVAAGSLSVSDDSYKTALSDLPASHESKPNASAVDTISREGQIGMNVIGDKQRAHELIERLDPAMITTAVRFLEFIVMDPLARSIATAPADEELLTEEEDQALDRAEAWLKANNGKGIPNEEVLAEFGLSTKDFTLK